MSAAPVCQAAVPSVRRRLLQVLVLVSLVWGLAVAAVVWRVVDHEVGELLDNALVEASEILSGLLHHGPDLSTLPASRALPAVEHEEHLVWQLLGADGQIQLRSHRAPQAALLTVVSPGLHTAQDGARVYAAPFGTGGAHLLVAQPGPDRSEARAESSLYAAAASLAVGLLCAAALMGLVRRELRPLDELSDAVRRYDPLAPGAHLAAARRIELQPIHEAISSLGQRLAQRVASERAFSAHAAHALRTPLAGVVAQLAAAQQVSSAEAQPMLAMARQATTRLRQVVGALLTLFRTGGALSWSTIPLARLVAQLPFQGLALQAEPQASVRADADLLAAALLNLLDNAQRHGATQASLSVRRVDGQQALVLQDDGNGLPEAQRLRLNAALQAQRYDGETGLGLMLADMVARAHGGQLLLQPAPQGCRVLMTLPEGPPRAA